MTLTTKHQARAERFLEARKRQKLTQAEAAALIGCARTTITGWENPDSLVEPSGDNLVNAARAYRVRVDWLQAGVGDHGFPIGESKIREPMHAYAVEAIESVADLPSEAIPIQHLGIDVSAGDGGEELVFVETKFPMFYRLEWFRSIGAKPENVRSMRVSGASMERTLFDGDRIAVDFGNTHVQNDRVYVIRLDGGTLVKRLFRHGLGGIRVVSDNEDKGRYPDTMLAAHEVDERLHIHGVVVDKSGRGGL